MNSYNVENLPDLLNKHRHRYFTFHSFLINIFYMKMRLSVV